jgi:hypothetical protein
MGSDPLIRLHAIWYTPVVLQGSPQASKEWCLPDLLDRRTCVHLGGWLSLSQLVEELSSCSLGDLFPVSSVSTVSYFGAAPSLSWGVGGGGGSTVKQHCQSGQQAGGRTLERV